MKHLSFLIVGLLIPVLTYAQSADEEMLATQQVYRQLNNLVIEGTTETTYNYLVNVSPPAVTRAIEFRMAMDREGNIAQELKNDAYHLTASFHKNAEDSLGLYTRWSGDNPTFHCSPGEAGARLGGTGGSAIYLFSSLFYPGYIEYAKNDSSFMLYYKKASRLPDSLINGELCSVILTETNFTITQEMADQRNHQRDSSAHLLDLPEEKRGGPRSNPGTVYSKATYWIRKSDHMIVRIEQIHDQGNTLDSYSKGVTTLDVNANVEDVYLYMD